jgi:transketolase
MNQKLSYIPRQAFASLLEKDCDQFEKTQLFADMCRLNTLYMIQKARSGHIGSSFSSLEIFSWLTLNEINWRSESQESKRDIFFSSKGHDAPGWYCSLISAGLLEDSLLHCLRREGGLPGHPDVGTPCVITNTGSLGMGISKAKGMIQADRLNSVKKKYFVLTGDGELQEGQIWESLATAVHNKMGELVVIVDHNKLQSDTYVEFVNCLGDLESKFKSFGWEVAAIDGHDLQGFNSTLRKFEEITDKPKIIIANTIKGKGISFIEAPSEKNKDFMYNFHSGALSPEDYQKAVNEILPQLKNRYEVLMGSNLNIEGVDLETPTAQVKGRVNKLVGAYSEALVAMADSNSKIMALDADLVLDTGLIPFRDRFPERFVECGIAEQDMVSQAGGMAAAGMLPIVHSFSCFLSTRPNEHIYNNASEKRKVVYVGSLSGLLPSGPGHSHQSVRDITLFSNIPEMTVFEPCCEEEVHLGVNYLINDCQESAYLRLVSIPCEIPFEYPKNHKLKAGEGVTLKKGTDLSIVSYGPVMLPQAYLAAEELEKEGLSVSIINMPWLNHIDVNWYRKEVEGVKAVLTIDNHLIKGGLASEIDMVHATNNLGIQTHHLGITDIPPCGENNEILAKTGLDANSIAKTAKNILGGCQ